MRGIILAAGYGTRLGELGKKTPKALLPVGGKTVIDHLLERLAAIGLREVLIVTNARFDGAFKSWLRESRPPADVELVCDGSTEPENRLGAVRDLALALEHVSSDTDLFVSASDNLYTSDLGRLITRFREVRSPVVALLRQDDEKILKRSGVGKIDEEGRLTLFIEKPEDPPSPYASPPLYVYPADVREDLAAFLADSSLDHDAPGNLVAFLLGRRPVYGVVLDGVRYDIGSLESYEEAKRIFGG